MPTYEFEHKNNNNIWITRRKIVHQGMTYSYSTWYTLRTPERLLAKYVRDLKKEYSKADDVMDFYEKYDIGFFDTVNEKHIYVEGAKGIMKKWVSESEHESEYRMSERGDQSDCIYRYPLAENPPKTMVVRAPEETLLHYALEFEMPVTVKELIQIGADVHAEEYTGSNTEIKDLLENADKIRARYLQRHPGIPKLWCETWGKLNWKDTSDEELCQQVDQLLADRADVYVRSRPDGFTAFLMAARFGHIKTLEKLAVAGSDTEARVRIGNEYLGALSFAAERGDTEMAQKAIELNDKYAHSGEPLYDFGNAVCIAIKNGHMQTAQKIIEVGSHSDFSDIYSDDRCEEEEFLKCAEKGDTQSVQRLIEFGIDVNGVKDMYGRSALHLAARNGHTQTVEKLVELKADIDAVDNDGSTAQHWAALYGHSETVEKLADLGADVRIRDFSGRAVLYYVAMNCSVQTAEKLFDAGARINVPDKNGWTPLQKAAEYEREDMVRKLIELGAIVYMKDRHGKSAFDKAGNREIVALLQNAEQIRVDYLQALQESKQNEVNMQRIVAEKKINTQELNANDKEKQYS